jgi:hypothetical protein
MAFANAPNSKIILERAMALLATFHETDTNEHVGNSLLFALVVHSLTARDKRMTLCEHFDGLREKYAKLFKLVQATGLEQDYEVYLQGQRREEVR